MGIGKLKAGAFTGFYDKNNNEIHVGDNIMLPDGTLWDVNAYLQIIPKGEGTARKLRESAPDQCYVVDEDGRTVGGPKVRVIEETKEEKAAETTVPEAEAAPDLSTYDTEALVKELQARSDYVPSKLCDWLLLTNQMLVKVLRDRGVEVTAREKIVAYRDL